MAAAGPQWLERRRREKRYAEQARVESGSAGPVAPIVEPPESAARLSTVATPHRWRYRRTAPASRADWSAIRFHDGAPISFIEPLVSSMPEQGIGLLPDAHVYGSQGWPVTRDGCLVIDAVGVHRQRRYRKFQDPTQTSRPVRLEGTVLNLSSIFSATNYGHALLDGLGRLGILLDAGIDPRSIDHVLMPGFPGKAFPRLLEGVGLDPAKAISLERRSSYRCDELWQPTFPGRLRHYTAAPARFMRAAGIAPAGSGRRLLILRKGAARAVANVEEMERIARQYDLELYEPQDSAFSPADFAAADLVVSAHGANMADIAAMAPGSKVVELMPSSHRYPYFATLGVSAGLDYTILDGRSLPGDHLADFTVDGDALRSVLDRLG